MLCCCGCGKIITFPDDRGRPRRYLPGHARRLETVEPKRLPPPACKECKAAPKALIRASKGEQTTVAYYCNDHIDRFRDDHEKNGYVVEICLLEAYVSRWKAL